MIEKRTYDLEERTARFAEVIIVFCKALRQDNISAPLVNQLIRAASSIGANYMEANSASSKRDFANKIYICKKESQETRHWLRLLKTCYPDQSAELETFIREAQELTFIFQKITSLLRGKV